jgi:hypothetical protein
VRQVADLLGLREDAVRQRLTRARSRLRQEMLDRLGETLQRTAPGATFTAGLMTSLALGAPPSAAAAGFGTAAKLSSGGLSKLPALLGGAVLGAVSGILGVVFGARPLLARARDEQERRGIRLYVAVGSTTTVSVTAVLASDPSALTLGLMLLLFYTIFISLIFGWLPRVTARRLAAELAEDPGARERHQRARSMQLLAAVVGFFVSIGAIFWGFT